jgi:hypothetical protein
MLYESIRGLKVAPSDIIIGILRKQEDALGATEGIHRMLGEEVRVLVFEEPTLCQADTIFKMLKMTELKEPCLIKETDNQFVIDSEIEEKFNYICVESLNNFQGINPQHKMYLQLDSNQLVAAMDNTVISDTFCAGGYYFTEPESYCHAYEKLFSQSADDSGSVRLYISEVVNFMLQENVHFFTKKVRDYLDWGTTQDWDNFHKRFQTYFVNLDGVVFERGSPFFHPNYREVKPNLEVVEELLKLQKGGNQIIFLSERDEGLRGETEAALTHLGFKSFKIIMSCNNTQHILVNARSPKSSCATATAVNLFEKEHQIALSLRGKY